MIQSSIPCFSTTKIWEIDQFCEMKPIKFSDETFQEQSDKANQERKSAASSNSFAENGNSLKTVTTPP